MGRAQPRAALGRDAPAVLDVERALVHVQAPGANAPLRVLTADGDGAVPVDEVADGGDVACDRRAGTDVEDAGALEADMEIVGVEGAVGVRDADRAVPVAGEAEKDEVGRHRRAVLDVERARALVADREISSVGPRGAGAANGRRAGGAGFLADEGGLGVEAGAVAQVQGPFAGVLVAHADEAKVVAADEPVAERERGVVAREIADGEAGGVVGQQQRHGSLRGVAQVEGHVTVAHVQPPDRGGVQLERHVVGGVEVEVRRDVLIDRRIERIPRGGGAPVAALLKGIVNVAGPEQVVWIGAGGRCAEPDQQGRAAEGRR